jgi:hypothetical protein
MRVLTEDVVHKGLEGGQGVRQSKRHHRELVVTLISSNGFLGKRPGS